MPDIRNQTGGAPDVPVSSPEYQAGYEDCKADAKRDLARTLRILAVGPGSDSEETLTDHMVRKIFTGTFGAQATDQTFGPEPTGRFNVRKLLPRSGGRQRD